MSAIFASVVAAAAMSGPGPDLGIRPGVVASDSDYLREQYVAFDRTLVGARFRETRREGRPIVNQPPHPYNRVDDTRRPGFNGRIWIGETFTSQPTPNRIVWPGPGPERYGAPNNLDPDVLVDVGPQVVRANGPFNTSGVRISPWVRVNGESLPRHERARAFWLREHGFTGGVRTHVNPHTLNSLLNGEEPPRRAEDIKPRATIQLRPDLPRQSGPKRQVDAGERSESPVRTFGRG